MPNYPGLKSKEVEAADLVSKLTLEEKIALCSGEGLWHLKGIPRLEMPSINITDGPHGLRKTVGQDLMEGRVPATCFPTASALAAAWDVDLLHEVGVALAHECLNEDVGVLLGPGMNIKRHPCCGRNFEYFSEDPYLTGKLGGALISGIQSQGVGTSMKHMCVNNQEHDRMRVSSVVDERTLREIYLKGFEMAIKEAQPWTVMCAYNKLNGVYCSENETLWDIVRNEWGFEGLVMTDWGASSDRIKGISAGVDLEMPGSAGAFDMAIAKAIKEGSLKEEEVDRTVKRNVALMLLAKDSLKTKVDVDMEAHHVLARRAAMECAVLLKNHDNILPLAKNTSVAVIGAFAKHPRYQGMGSSGVLPYKLDKAFDRFSQYTTNISYAAGYDHEDDGDNINAQVIKEAADAAKEADVAIIFCGLPGICESEGFDRTTLHLPPEQNALIEFVCLANSNTVVVLSNGPAVAMPWVDKPKAILEGYLGGQASGSAMVDLLFGEASPSGKLAETFPIGLEDVPADANFPGENQQAQYREGLNVGYRYFDTAQAPVLYSFGHGLSYTSFEYSDLRVENMTSEDDKALQVKVEVKIRNSGKVAGAEVIQCYIHDCESTFYRPEHELKGFKKVFLQSDEEKEVVFHLTKDAFHFYDIGQNEWIVEAGQFEIRLGSSSRDIRLKQEIDIQTGCNKPSQKAQTSYPCHLKDDLTDANDSLKIADDAAFALMLDADIPSLEQQKEYHRNSVVSELRSSFSVVGRILAFAVTKGAEQHMGEKNKKNEKAMKKMLEEMTGQIPLRSLVLFSEGKLNFEVLDGIIATLNNKMFSAAGLFFNGLTGPVKSTLSTTTESAASNMADYFY